jgi:ribosome-associated heat shock protein Hsp15
MNDSNTRIDKWLWMVRIFKTRSLATEECKKGRVKANDLDAKPSKEVKVGDYITVRKPPVTYCYVVKGFPKNRIGAKLVPEYLENITSAEELAKLEPGFLAFQGVRARGTGRPTKKERRTLDDILEFE